MVLYINDLKTKYICLLENKGGPTDRQTVSRQRIICSASKYDTSEYCNLEKLQDIRGFRKVTQIKRYSELIPTFVLMKSIAN